MPPKVFEPFLHWYLTRIYIHVRPERIYVWHEGDPAREPQLFDVRMEEVRSGHVEEPGVGHADPSGRRGRLGRAHGGAGRALPGRP